jgi:16S rRNA (adenine1518-N6/adenine1519-N6)-dimethyltransferase
VDQSSTRLPRPARRRFGQNFLVSRTAIARIVDALAPRRGESVVEIGPGRGALTAALLERVPFVTAIEIDRDLVASLRVGFPADRLRVIEADVLEIWSDLGVRPPLVVAGNLPYNISKPVAMTLISGRAEISRAVLMFQREVADRLTAIPGTPAYGPLSVLASRAFSIERLFTLPPGAFRPSPAVTSAVTRWTPRAADLLPPAIEPALKAVLRASFARRRQTILKNLRSALPGGEEQARTLLREAAIEPGLRAEALPGEAFMALAASWPV